MDTAIDIAHAGFRFSGDQLYAADKIDGGAGTDTALPNSDHTGVKAVMMNATTMINVEKLTLAAGHRYPLATNNATVATGQTLTVDDSALGAGNALTVYGAAETNRHFVIMGGLGADELTGGALSDTVTYSSAAQSTSTHNDTMSGFNFSSDIFDTPGAVGTPYQSDFDRLFPSASHAESAAKRRDVQSPRPL